MKRILSVVLVVTMHMSLFAVGSYASDRQGEADAYESIASVLEAVSGESAQETAEESAPAEESVQAEESAPVMEAAEEDKPQQVAEPAGEETVTAQHVYVNPLVADYVTEEDILAEIENRAPVLYAGSEKVCESFEEAGLFLREQIQNRADVVTLVLYFSDFPGYDSNELFNEGLDAILASAYEHTGDPLEGDYIRWHVYGYNSTASWSSRMMTLEIDFLYFDTLTQHNDTTPAVNNILNELQLDGKNHYQKVCAIYDYVTDTIDYDCTFPEVSHSAYAAAVKHLAVCQGYALLLYRLLLTVGVDCRIIVSEDHAWNIVKLGDSYYNLDATWDAETYQNQWFLKGSSTFVDHPAEAEYLTAAFKAEYPISWTDFDLSAYDSSEEGTTEQPEQPEEPGEPLEDEVLLDAEYFPDAIFRGIVESNFDTDESGGLSKSEILNATYLDCSQSGITSIQGVEYLSCLEGLDCYENALTEVNLSGNKALTYLDVGINHLEELDVSGCPNLEVLYCDYNELTELDVSDLSSLMCLYCESNKLTEVDISNNPYLEEFGCDEAVFGGVNLTETETGYTADLSGVVEDAYVYTWVRGYSEDEKVFDVSYDLETGKASFDQYPVYILVTSQINGYGWMRYVQIRITDVNTGVGDIDGNGNVNTTDLVCLMRHIIDAQSAIEETKADLNSDGQVDILDVIHLVRRLADAAA